MHAVNDLIDRVEIAVFYQFVKHKGIELIRFEAEFRSTQHEKLHIVEEIYEILRFQKNIVLQNKYLTFSGTFQVGNYYLNVSICFITIKFHGLKETVTGAPECEYDNYEDYQIPMLSQLVIHHLKQYTPKISTPVPPRTCQPDGCLSTKIPEYTLPPKDNETTKHYGTVKTTSPKTIKYTDKTESSIKIESTTKTESSTKTESTHTAGATIRTESTQTAGATTRTESTQTTGTTTITESTQTAGTTTMTESTKIKEDHSTTDEIHETKFPEQTEIDETIESTGDYNTEYIPYELGPILPGFIDNDVDPDNYDSTNLLTGRR
ncbi:hypothetical protein RF11_07792 [Thelohanellus kitauei]|uniref:Uncharacterized protein n=1 Tax=Thelohanellus kitauei TaxID=669202 RepID=A0A0C2JY53_THEKT|nr:hypothetical protein RF11_07792 [Thelohanellus kitauei]